MSVCRSLSGRGDHRTPGPGHALVCDTQGIWCCEKDFYRSKMPRQKQHDQETTRTQPSVQVFVACKTLVSGSASAT